MMPKPLAYAPNIENQLVTHSAEDEVQVNLKVSMPQTVRYVLRGMMALWGLLWAALCIQRYLSPGSIDAATFFAATVKITIVGGLFALVEIAQKLSRDSLRMNAYGFERHAITPFRELRLDVPLARSRPYLGCAGN